MKNKRGDSNLIFAALISLLVAAAVILAFVRFGDAFFDPVIKRNKDVYCENSKFWEEERGLKELLEKVDNGKYSQTNFFFSRADPLIEDDCNLVSFSFSQGINEVLYDGIQPKGANLCLCKIEDNLCDKYDCYNFKKFDQINTKQFSTEELENNMVLQFTKNGRTLLIEALGTLKSPQPITYSRTEENKFLDKEGLISNLIILFNTNEIKTFNPLINVEKTGFFLPEGIPNIEGFTKLFSITLAFPPSQGQSQEDYLSNPQKIDPSLVRGAVVVMAIKKEKLGILNSSTNLALYYKTQKGWESSPLTCFEQESEYLCKTRLYEFSDKFALSTIEQIIPKGSSEIQTVAFLTKEQRSNLIQQLAPQKGIDPLLIESILHIESRGNTKAVGPCGETGIAQIMPHTAESLGLSILKTVPTTGTTFRVVRRGICNENKQYADDYREFVKDKTIEELSLLDDRFHDGKAIEAQINYFASIKAQLEKAEIPTTNQNLAAAYNAGPGAVKRAKGVPDIELTKNYVIAMEKRYNELSQTA